MEEDGNRSSLSSQSKATIHSPPALDMTKSSHETTEDIEINAGGLTQTKQDKNRPTTKVKEENITPLSSCEEIPTTKKTTKIESFNKFPFVAPEYLYINEDWDTDEVSLISNPKHPLNSETQNDEHRTPVSSAIDDAINFFSLPIDLLADNDLTESLKSEIARHLTLTMAKIRSEDDDEENTGETLSSPSSNHSFFPKDDKNENEGDKNGGNESVSEQEPPKGETNEKKRKTDEELGETSGTTVPLPVGKQQQNATSKPNYTWAHVEDDDSEEARQRRRNRCFVWMSLFLLLYLIIFVLASLWLVFEGHPRPSTFDPRDFMDDNGAETDDDFFYEDKLIISPGNKTSEMAEYDYECDFNDAVAFPHVWDQCECDGRISVIPDDVADLHGKLAAELFPLLFNRTYDTNISSCDPTNMALVWLASGDNRDNGFLRQRFILAVFFFVMQGPKWDYTDGWLSPLNECLWLGCQCNNWNVINSLAVDTNNLFGTIPTELGVLDGLAALSLSRNHLTGTIPSEIVSLPRLRELWLYSNRLTGSIPSEIQNARGLRSLLAHTNFLSRRLPTEIGLLQSLTDLNLSFNKFSRFLPSELGRLKELKHLTLSKNVFSGSIPSEIGSLENLETMILSENSLYGAIPSSVGMLSNLVELRISRAGVGGFLPTEMGLMSGLEILELAQGRFQGTIPTEIGKLSLLENLQLYKNNLEGPIPTELGKMSNLNELRLNGNFLSGTIPKQLGNLRYLETMTFDVNELVGSVPEKVCRLNTVGVLSTLVVDCVNPQTGLGIDCSPDTCCSCRKN